LFTCGVFAENLKIFVCSYWAYYPKQNHFTRNT
jgi:hypothetical protein